MHVVTSKLQNDVANACRQMGISLVEEAIEPMTGYSVDIQLNDVPWKVSEFPQGCPRACAIEVRVLDMIDMHDVPWKASEFAQGCPRVCAIEVRALYDRHA